MYLNFSLSSGSSMVAVSAKSDWNFKISTNCKMYLFELSNVFLKTWKISVSIAICICIFPLAPGPPWLQPFLRVTEISEFQPNSKIYLFELSNMFLRTQKNNCLNCKTCLYFPSALGPPWLASLLRVTEISELQPNRKIICLNFQMYFSKLQKIFASIAKYVCIFPQLWVLHGCRLF